MVRMKKPDWKCVFTYVQSFYRRFRNGRDPPAPAVRKTIAVGAHEASTIAQKLNAERRIQVRSSDDAGDNDVIVTTCNSPPPNSSLPSSPATSMTSTSSGFSFDTVPDKPLSPEHQKRLLSKYCFDDDNDDDNFSGLRSVKSSNTRVNPKGGGGWICVS